MERVTSRGKYKARSFLDVARPPSRDPPPGSFARTDLKSGRASERGSRKQGVSSRRFNINA
eukprot:6377803-Pyramimonas_sp.AAC.2